MPPKVIPFGQVNSSTTNPPKTIAFGATSTQTPVAASVDNNQPLGFSGVTSGKIGFGDEIKRELAHAGNFFKGAADALTQSEQKAGQDIAGAASAVLPESVTGVADIKTAAAQHATDTFNLTKLIKDREARGLDTTNLKTALKNNIDNAPPQWSDLYPAINKSATQVFGDFGGVALDALSGGSLKGIKGFGLVKNVAQTAEEAKKARDAYNALSLSGKLAQIGKDTARTASIVGGIGYGYDVTQSAQNDKLDLTPGVGTVLSVGIPAAIGAARTGRALANAVLPSVASNLSGVPKGAYDKMKAGGVTEQIGKTTRDDAFLEARKQQKLFNRTIQDRFGVAKQDIIDQFDGVRIGMNSNEQNGLRKVATEFGFADQLPQNLNSMSAKETMDLLANINNIDPIKEFDSPITKNYKLALAELKDNLKTKAISQFGGDGGIFDKVYQDYSAGKKVLKDVSSIIGKNGVRLSPVQETTAKNRLMSVFNEDKGAYLNAIQTLEDKTGSKIIDKIAAAHLSNILPKTLRGGATGVIGLGSDLLGLATFPLSSPRVGSWIIQKVGGYSPSATEKLMNLSPKIRQSIYNAVSKENMSFDTAVEKYTKAVSTYAQDYIKDYIQNPKLGLSVQKVPKNDIATAVLSHADEIENAVNTLSKSGKIDLTDVEFAQGLKDLKVSDLKDEDIRTIYETLARNGRQDIVDSINKEVSTILTGKSPKFKQNPATGKMEGSLSTIPKELQPLAEEAKKYKSAEEFVKNYDGGLILDREKVNDWISGGPGSEVKISEILGMAGKKFMNDLKLPDIPVRVMEASEESIDHSAKIVWDKRKGLKSAWIDLEISPTEEFGVEMLAEKEHTILHELAHAKQLELGRLGADKIQGKVSETSADKHANYILSKTKSQLTDLWNKANKK